MERVTRPAAQPRRRRTQAERREATKTALLDATIECLVEYGYAGTTTSRVVERAGVSRGAQVHHFHTKAELVSEALRHLSERRLGELREQTHRLSETGEELGAALDLLWQNHSGPLFAASLELWVAARTDAELRASLIPVEREVISSTREFLRDAIGARGAELDEETLNIVVTLMLGVGLQSVLLSSPRAADAAWRSVRDRLVELTEPS